MTQDDLKKLVTRHLDRPSDSEPWSMRSGTVLYSDMASVRPGRFYLLGINPGGKETGEPADSIICNLAAPLGTNSYADQCWSCKAGYKCDHCEDGRLRPECRNIFQRRVCSLFAALHVEPKDILSTNLIFARSTELSKLAGKGQWLPRCWTIHLELLRQVRPKWIITLGFGEAFSAIRGFGTEVTKQAAISDDGDRLGWHRRLRIELRDGDIHEVGVLGLAHPGNRGFNRAGSSGAQAYPDVVKKFIQRHLLTEA